jgi:Holliday junction DNA helicase RuvA
MLTTVTGVVRKVLDDAVYLQLGPVQIEALVPELVRRHLQDKLDQEITLHTLFYLEGTPMQGRMVPRLIGFLSEAEREFFEIFCSVEGVGYRKGLKALSRPVPDIADAIQRQDTRLLATLSGIGKASAEKLVSSLKNKVTKFALMRPGQPPPQPTEPDMWQTAYQALLSVGHSAEEARRLLEKVQQSGQRFGGPEEILLAIYAQR